MKILAIDTSTHVLGIALADEERIVGTYVTNFKKNHSLRLMPAIDYLLKELNVKPEELDAVAAAKGPGSYTGVRIGVTTAKSLAWALGIPVYGISSLQVLARNGKHFGGFICPFIDARRGQVYTGLYKIGRDYSVETVAEDRIMLLEEWLAFLQEKQEPVLFLSQDWEAHEDTVRRTLTDLAVQGEKADMLPRPEELALLAYQQGEAIPAHLLVPEYTQPTEAEKKWLAEQEGKKDA
ncbi:tRNA (adenosine(37)-N6)-threonylcarbamoyltransferase complex dimerization subunit type 1 TsaB [Bacillus piscicola]|uniref:tRNA (adenosine(37)-N6)-threonylcarbamoyltransferase complex dimerization subunit type 1 TsaB n=1 Tax=Bacillus piscicola TaxID=1632684 RepID=UPI001F092466|nr:tRNA (adenosine(37)-N6)-threonylcarbamoyltransferase complex dimerization subunit type 1 TsaB [Bacillus piscicola]